LDRAATFLHNIPFFFLSGNGVASILQLVTEVRLF